MKTLKFKTGSTGIVTAQHPLAPVGCGPNCITYEVTEIPENEDAANVARLLNGTVTYFAEKAGRYSYKFAELCAGAILR